MTETQSKVEFFDVRTEAEAGTNLQSGLDLPETGVWNSMQLVHTADAHPKVIWKDRLLTFDLWQRGGTIMISLYCPKCLHMLRVETPRKKIEWSEEDGLSVETFTCTWELPDSDGREGERIIGGLNLCRWSVTIDPTRKVMDTVEGPIRVHGIAK